MKTRAVSAPYCSTISSTGTTLPFDFDIFAPSLVIMPWVNSRRNGSTTGHQPASYSAFVTKRAYIRCRMACSTPYWLGLWSDSAITVGLEVAIVSMLDPEDGTGKFGFCDGLVDLVVDAAETSAIKRFCGRCPKQKGQQERGGEADELSHNHRRLGAEYGRDGETGMKNGCATWEAFANQYV